MKIIGENKIVEKPRRREKGQRSLLENGIFCVSRERSRNFRLLVRESPVRVQGTLVHGVTGLYGKAAASRPSETDLRSPHTRKRCKNNY